MEKMSREEKTDFLLSEIKKKMDENGGIIKTSQITELGVDYRRILSWVKDGTLERVKSGYYSFGFRERSEEDLILGLFPDGILCLNSALYYHHYIDQKPYQWHIAIDKNTSKSRFKMDYPVIQPYYTEPEVLKLGVTEIPFAGGTMKIYNKQRMICDCLKFEEKLDRDIFKRALLSYIADNSKDIAELLTIARERKVLQKVQSTLGVWL
ncbi:MAG: type IV toxin-antitoxin system AbiEi family antitoxin domain-containing protein [Lachnospiraceae bacterium]|nr:type IV toxin-antitoxin system AbiEi family antitoxin domain-containing protein [Lachnospiraceae bacterium]MDE6980837.1 type IV toxin-antitoxin system AbiEi family antitoxin domain-containing protein [Lachnospiraceae bacterium]